MKQEAPSSKMLCILSGSSSQSAISAHVFVLQFKVIFFPFGAFVCVLLVILLKCGAFHQYNHLHLTPSLISLGRIS